MNNQWIEMMNQMQSMAKQLREQTARTNPMKALEEMNQLFNNDFWKNIDGLDESTHFENVSAPGTKKASSPKRSYDISTFPQVDIYQTKHEVIVSCAIPGLNRSSLKIELINQRKLYFEGLIRDNPLNDHQGSRITEEMYHGSFSRELDLPVEVRREGSFNKYVDGILEIHLIKKGNTKEPIPFKP